MGKEGALQEGQQFCHVARLPEGFTLFAFFRAHVFLLQNHGRILRLFRRNRDDVGDHAAVQFLRFRDDSIDVLPVFTDKVHTVDDGDDVVRLLFRAVIEFLQLSLSPELLILSPGRIQMTPSAFVK